MENSVWGNLKHNWNSFKISRMTFLFKKTKNFYRHKMKIPKNEWEHYGNNPFFKLFYEKYFGFSFLDIFKNVQFCLNFFSLTDEILLIFFTSFVMIISITPPNTCNDNCNLFFWTFLNFLNFFYKYMKMIHYYTPHYT